MLIRILLMVWLSVALLACGAAASQRNLSPQARQLVDRTLRNMVFVEGGSFMMGDYIHVPVKEGHSEAYWAYGMDSKPAHKVTLDGFHIQRYEVTFREYDIYTRANGLPTLAKKALKAELPFRQPDKPATWLSWHQARAYCRWLGEQTGLPFDLPTEAQWEYAARSRGRYVGFATDNGLYEKGRNFPPFERYGHPVGKYPPNPLGLYDMSANVDEWVLDWYAKDYYQHSPEYNPKGPETGTKKVIRGGSYRESPGGSTVYSRKAVEPGGHASILGFRCVINRDSPIPQAIIPDPKAWEKLEEKPPTENP